MKISKVLLCGLLCLLASFSMVGCGEAPSKGNEAQEKSQVKSSESGSSQAVSAAAENKRTYVPVVKGGPGEAAIAFVKAASSGNKTDLIELISLHPYGSLAKDQNEKDSLISETSDLMINMFKSSADIVGGVKDVDLIKVIQEPNSNIAAVYLHIETNSGMKMHRDCHTIGLVNENSKWKVSINISKGMSDSRLKAEESKWQCLNQIRELETSAQMYSVDHDGTEISQFEDLIQDGYIRALPRCSKGGSLSFKTTDSGIVVTCSVHGTREKLSSELNTAANVVIDSEKSDKSLSAGEAVKAYFKAMEEGDKKKAASLFVVPAENQDEMPPNILKENFEHIFNSFHKQFKSVGGVKEIDIVSEKLTKTKDIAKVELKGIFGNGMTFDEMEPGMQGKNMVMWLRKINGSWAVDFSLTSLYGYVLRKPKTPSKVKSSANTANTDIQVSEAEVNATAKECANSRRIMGTAVMMYNMDNAEPMDTLDVNLLIEQQYIKPILKCPCGGTYSGDNLTSGGKIKCSVHKD